MEFPDKLCKAIAEITHGFSFAYIQEAFVAALIAIARDSNSGVAGDWKFKSDEIEDGWVGVAFSQDDGDLDELALWVEIKKQVAILREGMQEKQ